MISSKSELKNSSNHERVDDLFDRLPVEIIYDKILTELDLRTLWTGIRGAAPSLRQLTSEAFYRRIRRISNSYQVYRTISEDSRQFDRHIKNFSLSITGQSCRCSRNKPDSNVKFRLSYSNATFKANYFLKNIREPQLLLGYGVIAEGESSLYVCRYCVGRECVSCRVAFHDEIDVKAKSNQTVGTVQISQEVNESGVYRIPIWFKKEGNVDEMAILTFISTSLNQDSTIKLTCVWAQISPSVRLNALSS